MRQTQEHGHWKMGGNKSKKGSDGGEWWGISKRRKGLLRRGNINLNEFMRVKLTAGLARRGRGNRRGK